MPHVIFITSLSYSGSTLLDLVLGGHPRLVGLGEVYQVIRPGAQWPDRANECICSCGSAMTDCVFWGEACSVLQSNGRATTEDKYQIVLDTFRKVFGKDCVPVDSSKYIPAMETLRRLPTVNLKVIHLIRDVRGFAISQINSLERHRPKDVLRGFLYRRPAFHFRRWYTSNRRIQRHLEAEGIESFQVGYEELALHPDLLIPKICDFLGENPDPSMLSLADSGSHSVLGNRMRHQPRKRQGIFYDNRWTYRNEWILSAALLPHIMRYNSREVYGNHSGEIWDS